MPRFQPAIPTTAPFVEKKDNKVTTDLWEVPSRETNDITADFLQHLHNGQAKDEALREAKLAFLKKAEPERRHPYFWAGQVLIGREAPLPGWYFRGWGIVILIAIILLAAGLWYAVRRRA